jgi:hypothetical protein
LNVKHAAPCRVAYVLLGLVRYEVSHLPSVAENVLDAHPRRFGLVVEGKGRARFVNEAGIA